MTLDPTNPHDLEELKKRLKEFAQKDVDEFRKRLNDEIDEDPVGKLTSPSEFDLYRDRKHND